MCGVLDVLRPSVTLMIKCQAVNLPPWKVVSWFPRVIDLLERIRTNLEEVRAGENPSKELLPTLSKHWEELTSLRNEEDDSEVGEDGDDEVVGSFHGVPVLRGWLVVGENVEREAKGKKQTLYTWEARDPYKCIDDLITLCHELKDELQSRYNDIISDEVKQMGTIFDFENMIESLSMFSVQDGKLSISKANRRDWDTCGREEFKEFYLHVCNLPHIAHLSDMNQELELFAHSSDLVLKNLKTTILNIVWHGLGGCAYEIFRHEDGEKIEEFQVSQLKKISVVQDCSIDKWFWLEFFSGTEVKGRICEVSLVESFYNNDVISESLGQEMCIALDVALASGSCEAVVEGFYSVVKAHKQYGGQSNDVLMHRAVVDWCIPQPITCKETMLEIGKLYSEGSKVLGISKHRSAFFSNVRERAAMKYKVSKVVDRIAAEEPRCPHIVN